MYCIYIEQLTNMKQVYPEQNLSIPHWWNNDSYLCQRLALSILMISSKNELAVKIKEASLMFVDTVVVWLQNWIKETHLHTCILYYLYKIGCPWGSSIALYNYENIVPAYVCYCVAPASIQSTYLWYCMGALLDISSSCFQVSLFLLFLTLVRSWEGGCLGSGHQLCHDLHTT